VRPAQELKEHCGQKNVGAGLLAKAACQSPQMLPEPPFSQASQLPHLELCQAENLSSPPIPCGSGLAREDGVSATTNAARATAFAGKPAPTFGAVPGREFELTPDPLWERACSRRRHVSHHKCCPNHRFRRQATHLDLCQSGNLSPPPIPCGSGLARESGLSGTDVLPDPPYSRASPLPHGFCARA
jgi:hypothetical protein